jgi:hypothetical protein
MLRSGSKLPHVWEQRGRKKKTVGRSSWVEDQPVARPLPTHRITQTQKKCTQTFMPRVEFEPTIPVLERVKIFYALDHAATVIGHESINVFIKRGFTIFISQ